MTDRPDVEDAVGHLVAVLASEDVSGWGHDVWLNAIVTSYWSARGRRPMPGERGPEVERLARPFYDAAWELCRMGVLHPGQAAPVGGDGGHPSFFGNGFSLTEL